MAEQVLLSVLPMGFSAKKSVLSIPLVAICCKCNFDTNFGVDVTVIKFTSINLV